MTDSCRLCCRQTKLIKAHIIPEAFFRAMNRSSGTPLLVSNKATDPFPKRTPIGLYDTKLLCADCESLFAPLDDYGARVLLKQTKQFFQSVRHVRQRVAIESTTVDQDLLLRFFLSVLWRASASAIPYYDRVDLGSAYQSLAERTILAWNEPVSPVFSVVLSMWTSGQNRPNDTGTMSPFEERWHGVNAYRFYFSDFVAYIKVDKRPFSSPLIDLALCSRPELIVVGRNFAESKDMAAIRNVALQSLANRHRIRNSST